MSWLHTDLTVAAGGPESSTVPSGYMFDAQGTQHVVHVGQDGHVHELWWDTGGWHHFDLTLATGAPAVDVRSSDFNPERRPVGYVFTAQGTQHVVYVSDGHVHEFWWDGTGWHHRDLTGAIGAPPAASVSPCAYVFDAEGTQHVDYIGIDDRHVHELWWDSSGWHHHDLTTAAVAGAAAALVSPAAHVFGGDQHVDYVGIDGNVHELVWHDAAWSDDNVTSRLGIPTTAPTSLASYAFVAGHTRHVHYIDNGSVHELWRDVRGWQPLNVSAVTNAPGPAPALCAWPFESQRTRHVAYPDDVGHVHELWWDGSGWHHNDVTHASAAAPADQGTPAGYVFVAAATQHVAYIGIEDNHIHELRWQARHWPVAVPPGSGILA